ncbi:hypothetical protein PsorP6_017764 [Peronosclerospora sorghi]|uniref:Uncharacterized protein n=1 Tax=Peronosclerospora sorghi TaxID=230839 RepID=A0ACC0WMP9_9STRA|nr:hypothetical protein PsorP6_017764 [Peronosclerospora sorghi]
MVLDESGRMIDMCFEPQAVAVLENIGSMLKSKNEDEMEKQLTLANGANVVRATPPSPCDHHI